MGVDARENKPIPQNRQFAETSRRITSRTTAESEYRAGYTTIAVKSVFEGTSELHDLIYALASQKLLDVGAKGKIQTSKPQRNAV